MFGLVDCAMLLDIAYILGKKNFLISPSSLNFAKWPTKRITHC